MMVSPCVYREEINTLTVAELMEEKRKLLVASSRLARLPNTAPGWQRSPSPKDILDMTRAYLVELDKELSIRKAAFEASEWYVSFEMPKGDCAKAETICSLKRKIRESVITLSANKGEIAFGQYCGMEEPRGYDLENMLFYNIGASAFAECAKYGIAFAELQRATRCLPHEYCYQIVSIEESERLFPESLVACWESAELSIGENKPDKYYHALRSIQSAVLTSGEMIRGDFALRLHLVLNRKVNLASYMKAVLDGVICAFHYNQADTAENSDISCIAVNRPCRQRNGAWNPADDRLKLCLITVEYGQGTPSFSGKLYALP